MILYQCSKDYETQMLPTLTEFVHFKLNLRDESFCCWLSFKFRRLLGKSQTSRVRETFFCCKLWVGQSPREIQEKNQPMTGKKFQQELASGEQLTRSSDGRLKDWQQKKKLQEKDWEVNEKEHIRKRRKDYREWERYKLSVSSIIFYLLTSALRRSEEKSWINESFPVKLLMQSFAWLPLYEPPRSC